MLLSLSLKTGGSFCIVWRWPHLSPFLSYVIRFFSKLNHSQNKIKRRKPTCIEGTLESEISNFTVAQNAISSMAKDEENPLLIELLINSVSLCSFFTFWNIPVTFSVFKEWKLINSWHLSLETEFILLRLMELYQVLKCFQLF